MISSSRFHIQQQRTLPSVLQSSQMAVGNVGLTPHRPNARENPQAPKSAFPFAKSGDVRLPTVPFRLLVGRSNLLGGISNLNSIELDSGTGNGISIEFDTKFDRIRPIRCLVGRAPASK